MTVIELSHPVHAGMVTYRGLPGPKITREASTTGTNVDSPARPFDGPALRWDRHFGTAEYGPGGHPYLTADAVDLLVNRDAALVGMAGFPVRAYAVL